MEADRIQGDLSHVEESGSKKAVVSVVGKDRVGIIAKITTRLAAHNINILDISQTIMQGLFTMMMIVDLADSDSDVPEIRRELDELGLELGIKIDIQREQVFTAMHRL